MLTNRGWEKKMNEKISIIVPIYNVEMYLEECINSLIHQTYSNIEIILIDDGSSDSSGKICDKYKKIDNRIRVVHKENGGVSSARNAGIRLVNTKYISFVDPDDYVSEQFIEKLYNSLVDNSADIAVCNFFTIREKNIIEDRKIKNNSLNQEEALRLLVKDEIMSSYLWNKMFKKELFENLQFDIGYRYEDIRIMHKIFLKAKKIVMIEDSLYYYRIRMDSITNSTLLNNSKELIDALEERCNDLKGTIYFSDSYMTEMLQIRRILLEILIHCERKEEFYHENMHVLKKLFKQNYKKINVLQRIKFILFFIFPQFYAKHLYSGGKNE